MQYSVKLLVAALFALSPAAHPALREFALAQVAQAPAFSLPETVPSGTALSIQSSPNLGYAANALRQEFEAAYNGTEVGVEVTSSDEAIAPHVLDQPGVTIVPMHQTLPDDPRYPYSQPRYFVYRGEPGPAVAAFLGYATSAAGATALTAAQVAEAGAAAAGITAPVDPVPEATPVAASAETAPVAQTPAETAPADNDGGFAWWWLLLPLLALGGLAWAIGRGRSGMAPGAVDGDGAIAPPTPEHPLPPTVEPAVVPLADPEPVAAAVPPAPEFVPEPAPEPVVMPPVVEPAPEIITVAEVPPAPAPVAAPPVPKPAVVPPAIPAVLGLAGLAGAAAASLTSTEDQAAVEASKFDVVGHPADGDLDLSTIDDGLPPLPDGYGDSRIVLMARDPQWAYAYWDTPHTHKEELRRQGGEQLALRLYDVTGINLNHQAPHSLQQVGCDEIAREWYMQIPVSDRDYQVEIGYLAGDGRWLVLARSNTIRIPPVYPSDWSEEHFLTVAWQDNLRGQTIVTLVDPSTTGADASLHEQLYALSHAGEALRIDGSLFGSMQHMGGSMAPPISSFIYASGAGLGAAAMVPGLTMSGVSGFTLSGFPGPGAEFPGLTMSGVSGLTMSGFSGLTMSGVGLGASMPPLRPRKFWLVADAELIVYGATEPDASVTVAGVPIELSKDGTFRFQTSFQDGNIDYPIMAVAADGEQSRNIHITFERQTPERHTNTKDEAQEEWPGA